MEPAQATSPDNSASQLSLLRRYISEIVIVVLASCVIYLFKSEDQLHQNIIDYYKTDKSKDIEIIIHNSSIVESNNIILRDIREIIRESTHVKIDTSKYF